MILLTLFIEEFLDSILADKGSYTFQDGQVIDTRTYKTFKIPLHEFIQPLFNERMALKEQKGNPMAQAKINC
jgi:hypothetical protein